MARLLTSYEDVKADRGVIDFEDVLLLTVGILREHEEIARAVRGQYRHFVVDEYQDVNRLQQTLLDLWLGERRDICVVGDPAQTIYSFTGASPEHLLGFRTRHPEAHVVELVRNYRSTPQVVRLANLVLSGPGGSRRSGSVELRAQRPDGPAPELVVADNDPDEAARAATRIESLMAQGHPASEIAVLFRTNGQSEGIESALAERGIPYLVRGGERFFSRKEVRDAVVLLRGAARSDDGSVPLPDLVRDVLLGAGWSRVAPTSGGASRDRWQSLNALAELSDQLHALEPEARMPAFVGELEQRSAEQNAPTVQGVTLASFHAAKGLEWDTVLLVGCSDGLLPISMADTVEAVEEERRLLYVGVTRARERLVLSYAGARTPGGQGHPPALALPRRHRRRARRGGPLPAEEPQARQGRRQGRHAAPLAPAGSATATSPRPRSAPSVAAPRAPPPPTRRCSRPCARGASSRPRRPTCPRTSCSPTPPSPRSPSGCRSTPASWPRSAGSGRPSSSAGATPSWPFSENFLTTDPAVPQRFPRRIGGDTESSPD